MNRNEWRSAWILVSLASAILMLVMGIRQTVGLFIQPIAHSTALNIVDISFAVAVGQLMWGVFQPVFGAIADKRGPFTVLMAGALLLALGQLGTIWAYTPWALLLTLGILGPAGAGASSFSVLIGAMIGRLPVRMRSLSSGVINAGGSVGQFLFAPLVQLFIGLWGYVSALWMLAGAALLTVPLARVLCPAGEVKPQEHSHDPGLKSQIVAALKHPGYLLLNAGYFTCGFHVAFLVTHLPGEVAHCGHAPTVSAMSLSLIGLCNIAGSLFAGYLGNYFRMKYILTVIYASRAVMITLFLLSPKDVTSFYIFAAATGLTWLATVPPTVGIVGKLFGMRYLATLFGLVFFTHQVGGFFGAYLGGLAMARFGDYQWMWYTDIALASLAAVINLPIKEKSPKELMAAENN